MSERSPVTDLLAALAGVFVSLHLRWYLFGAQAVMIWGRPRMSADVDVTAELVPEATPSFVAAMSVAGFSLRVRTGIEEFIARTRVLPFVHEPTRIPVDVVLAGPGLEEGFLDRAIVVDLGGTDVPVLSPEDLIVTKTLAGRPKDVEDILSILQERRSTLDVGRIRYTLDLLERALGQSDLRPLFESQLGRATGEG